MHRFVEHVGEVELELQADDEAGIFEDALAAFAEIVSPGPTGAPASFTIELCNEDHALLLADWLSELIFLGEVHAFTPEGVDGLEIAHDRLRANVRGRRNAPRHVVKAVTLHRLELSEAKGAWHGRVVLDV